MGKSIKYVAEKWNKRKAMDEFSTDKSSQWATDFAKKLRQERIENEK